MPSEFAARAHQLVAAGNLEEAAQWFGKAVQADPGDAGSLAWLGQCLCGTGRRAEGTECLRQAGRHFIAMAQRSGEVSLLLELTGELQHWSDFEGAHELGEATTRIAPRQARGFQLLALSLAQLNRIDAALAAGRQALALEPDSMAMQVLQASLETDAGQYAASRLRLQTLLEGRLEAREEYRARKELARVLDRLGETGGVFAQLHAAAALAPALPDFAEQNAAAIPALIRNNRQGFDRQLVERWSRENAGRGAPDPVFVLGFMRSGTTLTQEVLAAHSQVFVSDEADFIPATLRELHRMNPARLGTADKLRRASAADMDALRAFYWRRVRQRFGSAADGRLFVDKLTMNTIDLGFINCLFPRAKIVFVQRDPRDVCLSCFMQLMVPSPTTVQLLQWNGTASLYAQVMEWWIYFRRITTLDMHELRYEDAVAAFEPSFRKLFAFLGLDWQAQVVDFHRQVAGKYIASPSRSQVARPLYTSSVARWRRYEREFQPIAATLAPFAREFGYAPFTHATG